MHQFLFFDLNFNLTYIYKSISSIICGVCFKIFPVWINTDKAFENFPKHRFYFFVLGFLGRKLCDELDRVWGTSAGFGVGADGSGFCRLAGGGGGESSSSSEKSTGIFFPCPVGFGGKEAASSLSRLSLKVASLTRHSWEVGTMSLRMFKTRLIELTENLLNSMWNWLFVSSKPVNTITHFKNGMKNLTVDVVDP